MHPPSKGTLLAGVAVALTAFSALSTPRLVAAQEDARVIPFLLRPPIVERLLPTDRVVIVQRDWETPVVGHDSRGRMLPASAKRSIRSAAADADVVAIVDVERSTTLLTASDSPGAVPGSWVATRLTGSVREVVRARRTSQVWKSRRIRLKKGDQITVDEPRGGEIRIGDVLVKAGDIPPFPTGRRYLVFVGAAAADDEPYQTVYRPLLIEDDKLVHLPVETSALDLLHGLSLKEATRMMRPAP